MIEGITLFTRVTADFDTLLVCQNLGSHLRGPEHPSWQRSGVLLLVVEHDTVDNRALDPMRGHHQAAAMPRKIVAHLRPPP
jgi:hypothetical protein